LLRTASTAFSSISGTVLGEHLAHAHGVLHVGEHGHHPPEVTVELELAPDLEQAVLGVVDEHHLLRPDACDLPAQLRADRAAGPRHEHHLAAHVGAHPVHLHAHRLAAEHVLHAHLAHLVHEVDAAGEQLEHGRQRAHGDVARAASGHDLLAQNARRRRDRDDHLVGLGVVEDARQVVGRALDLDARDAHAALARIVVHEADRRGAERRVALQLGRHQLAAVAGADDQHLARVARREAGPRGPLHDHPHEESHADQEREREQQVERDHPARRVRHDRGRDEEEHAHHQEGGDHDGAHDRLEVLLVDEAPQLVVEAEGGEHDQLARHDEADRQHEQARVARRQRRVEAQHEREPVRQRDEAGVDRHLDDPPRMHR
jgi:hypothetical protein